MAVGQSDILDTLIFHSAFRYLGLPGFKEMQGFVWINSPVLSLFGAKRRCDACRNLVVVSISEVPPTSTLHCIFNQVQDHPTNAILPVIHLIYMQKRLVPNDKQSGGRDKSSARLWQRLTKDRLSTLLDLVSRPAPHVRQPQHVLTMVQVVQNAL